MRAFVHGVDTSAAADSSVGRTGVQHDGFYHKVQTRPFI